MAIIACTSYYLMLKSSLYYKDVIKFLYYFCQYIEDLIIVTILFIRRHLLNIIQRNYLLYFLLIGLLNQIFLEVMLFLRLIPVVLFARVHIGRDSNQCHELKGK